MKITIKVTKEIYRKSMMCSTKSHLLSLFESEKEVQSNCAIALSVREIAPNAHIARTTITWTDFKSGISSFMPDIAVEMIERFDDASPEKRLNLPEFSFEVDFPDELVSEIGIDQVHKILAESETLALA